MKRYDQSAEKSDLSIRENAALATSEKSNFVDRINALKFRSHVLSPNLFHNPNSIQRGKPFAHERSEASVAHRVLEHDLKPAAKTKVLKNRGLEKPNERAIRRRSDDRGIVTTAASFFGRALAHLGK